VVFHNEAVFKRMKGDLVQVVSFDPSSTSSIVGICLSLYIRSESCVAWLKSTEENMTFFLGDRAKYGQNGSVDATTCSDIPKM